MTKRVLSALVAAMMMGACAAPVDDGLGETDGVGEASLEDGKADGFTLTTSGTRTLDRSELLAQRRAAALAADPAFEALLGTAVEVAAIRLVAGARMTREERRAYEDWVDDFPRVRAEYSPDQFLAANGLATDLDDEQRGLLGELIARYGLGGLSRDDLGALFGRAAAAYNSSQRSVGGWIEYEIHEIDPDAYDDVSDECLADCAASFAKEAAAALQAYIIALAACTATGPGWPFCVASATASYGFALAFANDALQNCKDACAGITNDDYCQRDADCDDDEYCHKGFLGIGLNECRPKKSQGATCSRGGQCRSGCCKYHPASNLVSPVCRPADRC